MEADDRAWRADLTLLCSTTLRKLPDDSKAQYDEEVSVFISGGCCEIPKQANNMVNEEGITVLNCHWLL